MTDRKKLIKDRDEALKAIEEIKIKRAKLEQLIIPELPDKKKPSELH